MNYEIRSSEGRASRKRFRHSSFVIRHFPLAIAVVAFSCSIASAQPSPNPQSAIRDPQFHTGAGLKQELIAGITEADFLRLGAKPKTVRITLVASFTDDNSGMNFNGCSRGSAIYTIPVGWLVEVTFVNPSPVPHSAILVERDTLRAIRLGDPVFKGASTPNSLAGISTGKAEFSFTASEPGEYALACGIPTHATGGHWVALNVSDKAKAPSLKLGEKPAVEARSE